MNVRTTRFLKEARPLFWPWCAVAIVACPRLIHPSDGTLALLGIGFFFGIPLLAALSFGNEFQQQTLFLLLSQPVGRMKIWGEKMSVTVLAVVSAALVFSLALRATSLLSNGRELHFAEAWIVASIASATFWTLLARSTVGGVALTIAAQLFIYVPLNLVYRYGIEYLSLGKTTVVPTIPVVFLSYGGVMLWLGRRTLARFQATGGMAGDDLLTTGPNVMPGALGGWLRCRPTGAVLNLVRKELRLLRPVWLVSLVAGVGWICLILFALVYERGSTSLFTLRVASAKWPGVVWMVGVSSTLIIAILAGSLSLGEERTSGTQAWHMTLPVPTLVQWRIKLYMALFTGLLGAALLPILLVVAGGYLFGSPFLLIDVSFGIFWLFTVLLLSFAAFWCACATNGTVPAVLCVFPVMILIGLASTFGERVGSGLIDLLVSRFHVFADFKFTNAVVSMFQTILTGRFSIVGLMYSRWPATPNPLILLAPTLLLAIIQSYRLFRAQIQESILGMIRNLYPLALVAFLWTFSLTAISVFVDQAWAQQRIVFDETIHAIQIIQPGAAKLEATRPLQLTEEDLARAFPLSARTRRWLRNSRVTIVPIRDLPHHISRPGSSNFSFQIDDSESWYLATIYLAGGSNCTGSGIGWAGDLRMLYVVCQ